MTHQCKRKSRDKEIKNPKAFIDYLQIIDYIYENLEDYNATKKRKVLIVVDDVIADMEANKMLSHIVTELFFREKKLNISFVFISQSNFKVYKATKLSVTHFIMKIPNKRELKQIGSNHLSVIEFKDFMKLYKDYILRQWSKICIISEILQTAAMTGNPDANPPIPAVTATLKTGALFQ